ncbi:MAG: 3-hydroxyacyl-CoA dehydrogenase NAD-binding domain-containing protein [Candidatus Latescibacterota bacterium]|nr:3-hydroxyacyl-CoA dehydrogenase NAD-binding domain-containing protein [Candidatus Latescibacterota bacterium]
MSEEPLRIERVVVLGAGVMGSQIAALFANAGIEVDLLDLADDKGDPKGRAQSGVEGLASMWPPPLFLPEFSQRIHTGSLEDPEEAVARADWVVEAVVEDLAIKEKLYARIEGLTRSSAIVSTNTSGICISDLAEGRSREFGDRFFGVHFFNPPLYMELVEVIPGPTTRPEIIVGVTAFLETGLGKGVVQCRDTPNFIANRLGVFAVLDALHRMAEMDLRVEEVDALTGPALGRPRSATLRLCDLIGLDTLLNVAGTAHRGLPYDDRRRTFRPAPIVQRLVDCGRLGAKTRAGFYRKGDGGLEVVDAPSTDSYRPLEAVEIAGLVTRGPLGARLHALDEIPNKLGEFVRGHVASSLLYAVARAGEISETIEDIDRTMRWGFNWEAGPFEMIDALGGERLENWAEEAGLVLDDVPLLRMAIDADPATFYAVNDNGEEQSLDPTNGERRLVRRAGPLVDGERLDGAQVVLEAETGRALDLGDGIGVFQFDTKLNVLGREVLELAVEATSRNRFRLLVLTGAGSLFSAGADLKYVLRLIDEAKWDELETYLQVFQRATGAMRYAGFPVVAAADGLALGGGCEFCLTSSKVVASAGLRIGLVETKVGVIPGAGGCREIVRRHGADIENAYATLLSGWTSDNGWEARKRGFLTDADDIRLDGKRLLLRAIEVAEAQVDGWKPESPTNLEVAGWEVEERLVAELQRRHEAEEITKHDAVVGTELAHVLCGGGSSEAVPEERILDLERESFLKLCGMSATRSRIEHMLTTGKPLRN